MSDSTAVGVGGRWQGVGEGEEGVHGGVGGWGWGESERFDGNCGIGAEEGLGRSTS